MLTVGAGGPVPSAYGICFLSGYIIRQNDYEDDDYIKLLVDFGEGEWDQILATFVNGVEFEDYWGSHVKYEHLGTDDQAIINNLFTEDAANFRNHVIVEFKLVKGDEIKSVENITVVARTRKCLEIGQDIGGTKSFTRNPAQILWDFYLKRKGASLSELSVNGFNSLKAYCEASLCYTDKNYYPVNVLAPSYNLVKATSWEDRWGYYPQYLVNQDKPVTGAPEWNCWASDEGSVTNQRINIDFGRKVVLTRLRISNYHNKGAETDIGIKNFELQGSNTASDLAHTTYADAGSSWVSVKAGLQAAQHPATDTPSWEDINITPHVTGYRYYSIKIADNWGDAGWMGLRQVRFFTGNASGACTGDETNIRYAFDYNFDTKIDINDAEKIICQSFNGQIIRSQGVYKPVWDGAQEADGAGGLQNKAVQHAFTVSTNVVNKTLNWQKLEHPNIFIINCMDSSDGFKKNSDSKFKNDQDIGIKGEVPIEETCWWLIDIALAARRCKWKHNKGQYPDYMVGLTGGPDSQAVELYDRTTVTDTQAGWTAKDVIVVEKDEDPYGRSKFVLEAYLSGVYEDKGFEVQPGYAIRGIDPNKPLQVPAAADVTVSVTSGAAADAYANTPVRIQFTPPNNPTYSHTEIWVSTDDVTYYLAGQDSDGDAYIDGLGTWWDYGDTVYVKLTHVTVAGVKNPLPADEHGSVATSSIITKRGGFYFGQYDMWGGNAALANAATTIVLGGLDGTPKLALGPTADSLTLDNIAAFPGFYVDGTGSWRGGNATHYLQWDAVAGTFTMAGVTMPAGSAIAGTTNDTFTINSDLGDVTAQLILGRTTGGNATFGWDGTKINLDTKLQVGGVGCGSLFPMEIVAGDSGLAITATNTAAGTESYVAGFIKDANLVYQKVGAIAFQWTDNNVIDGYASWNAHTTYWSGGSTCDEFGLSIWAKHGAKFFPATIGSGDVPGANILEVNGTILADVASTVVGYFDQTVSSDTAYSALALRNTSVGTSALTRFKIGNNISAIGFHIDLNGGNFTDHPYEVKIMQEFTAPLIFGISGNECARIDSSGKILIGVTSSTGGKVEILSTTEQLRLDYDVSNYASFKVGSGGNLTIAPTGDLLLNPTGNDVYPTNNYDINLGLLTKKFLTLHAAELWVETLVAQETIATIGGRILVGPTTCLVEDLASGDTHIHSKYNNLVNGDIVYMEAGGKVEFLSIDSVAGGVAGNYTYDVTRDKDGSGANDWYAGDAIFDTGAAGSGWIDIYSVRGVKAASEEGPTIVGNVRIDATYNNWVEAWAVGNLNGLYGYAVDTYGAAFGKYQLANYITIDPTNGIRFFDHADAVQAQLTEHTWTMGLTTSEHVSISSTSVQIKDGATVYTDLTAGVMTLGDVTSFRTVINSSLIAMYDSGGKNQITLEANNLVLGYSGDGEFVTIDPTNGVRLYSNATLMTQITAAGVGYFGDQSNEHVKVSSSGVQIYDGATLYATYGATTTIGLTASEHISISGTEVQFKDGATVYTELKAGVLTLGDTVNEYVKVSSSGFQIYDGATLYATYGATTTIGLTASEHVSISATSVQFKDGATVYTDLTAGVLTLGDTANEHVHVDTSGLTIQDGATTLASFGATVTVGKVAAGENNVYIDADGMYFRVNATNYLTITDEGISSLNMLAGSDITLTGNDASPAKIIFVGGGVSPKQSELYMNTAGDNFYICPKQDDNNDLYIGASGNYWDDVNIYADNTFGVLVYYDADTYALLRQASNGGEPYADLSAYYGANTYASLYMATTSGTPYIGLDAFYDANDYAEILAQAANGASYVQLKIDIGGTVAGLKLQQIAGPYLVFSPLTDSQMYLGDGTHCFISVCSDAWTTCSDARLKTDIKDDELGLDFIDRLSPKTFRWNDKKGGRDRGIFRGVLAQDILKVLEDIGVSEDDIKEYNIISKSKNKDGDERYSMSYNDLFNPIINAIKELHEEIKNHTH